MFFSSSKTGGLTIIGFFQRGGTQCRCLYSSQKGAQIVRVFFFTDGAHILRVLFIFIEGIFLFLFITDQGRILNVFVFKAEGRKLRIHFFPTEGVQKEGFYFRFLSFSFLFTSLLPFFLSLAPHP